MAGRHLTRRQFVLGTTVGAATLAGCLGGGSGGDGSDGASDPTPTADGTTATPTTTSQNEGPDPDCSLLSGSQTPYDAAGTPFVFEFDYPDTWEMQDPLEGPGGRNQGVSSPVVRVDGESESAGIRVGQRFDPLTATQVEAAIAERTGESSPFEVVHEQSFDGETVRMVGFPESNTPSYRAWLPYGPDDDRRYYPFEMDTLTSILRAGGGEGTVTLCNDAVLAAVATIRESLRPNPGTTIDDV